MTERTHLQPPVGTVYHTQEELLQAMARYGLFFWSANCEQLTDCHGGKVLALGARTNLWFPYKVIGEHPDFEIDTQTETTPTTPSHSSYTILAEAGIDEGDYTYRRADWVYTDFSAAMSAAEAHTIESGEHTYVVVGGYIPTTTATPLDFQRGD